MTGIAESMRKAVMDAGETGNIGEVIERCARVAEDANGRLLAAFKVRGNNITTLEEENRQLGDVLRAERSARFEAEEKVRAYVITKREHFAALSMQGILGRDDWGTIDNHMLLATASVKYADALLAALEVKP